MNILLVGGSGSFINNIIIKLNKEGHRIYLLTGSKYKQAPYQKVFERYDFTFDSPCLNEIFESVSPDLTLYMGAYDTTYLWQEEDDDANRYVAGVTNLLTAYSKNVKGRFIYLSSDEVYSGNHEENIKEDKSLTPAGHRAMALALAENQCQKYQEYKGKDVIVLRLDHLYSIPKKRREINNICARLCLEALQYDRLTVVEGNSFSLIYETDAVEYIYRIIAAKGHKHNIYNISSSVEISEYDVAVMVRDAISDERSDDEEAPKMEIFLKPENGERRVLSNTRYDEEFGYPFCCKVNYIVERIAEIMKKKKYAFLYGDRAEKPLWRRIMDKWGWFVKTSVPFVENIIAFFLFFWIEANVKEGSLFSKLDFLLIYVLLFAVFYGQQQAIFSAVIAIVGYCINQMLVRSDFRVVLDADTYIWIAELFVVGLVVGYIKDQLTEIKNRDEEEREYLADQLTDIQDIHSSSVRVKDALETQIINQSDSVGKIYSITSELDRYSSEEVLFYAADVLAKLMKTKDVAIYTVSNADYARLFSYTSVKAKSLGNSIRYPDMEDLYTAVAKKAVFINRKMDERYPLMANAIFENDKMQMLVFVWGISWEQMTLGQANQLSIVSSLIQNAVLRANRYMEALEQQRYVEASKMLVTDAFTTLVSAYMKAGNKGFTECTLLRIIIEPEMNIEAGKVLAKMLRLSDYVGTLPDGGLYVLLANTAKKDADFVINRFKAAGYDTEVVEEKIV